MRVPKPKIFGLLVLTAASLGSAVDSAWAQPAAGARGAAPETTGGELSGAGAASSPEASAPVERPSQPALAGAFRNSALPDSSLSEEARLARASMLFDSGRYDECVQRFHSLLDPTKEGHLKNESAIERSRVYLAACLTGLGRVDEADAVLEKAILANPLMSPPDSLAFPEVVIDRFLKTRQRLVGEIRRAEQARLDEARRQAEQARSREDSERRRIEELEYLASQEIETYRNERWIACVPFGVGQFQNGDPALGWLFLGSELLLGGGVVGSLVADRVFAAQDDPTASNDANRRASDARGTAYDLLLLSSYGFLGVATLGVIEAQVSFVPEVRSVRSRTLPKRLRAPEPPAASLRPLLGPDLAGLAVGGAF